MALARPRAVIFDWDNTLVDSWECIRQSYNMTFRHFGMAEWSMEQTQGNVAASMRDSFPAMFGERWPEANRVFTESFAAIHQDFLRPLPEAAEMLAELRDLGLVLAVVSNKRGTFLRKEADILGWTPFFAALVGADDAPADKPDPAPVHLDLAGTGLEAGPGVWFVGDSPIDAQCAVNSGCVPVVMRPHAPYEGEFSAPIAQFLPSCRALADLAREL